jgi:hypothetical protein
MGMKSTVVCGATVKAGEPKIFGDFCMQQCKKRPSRKLLFENAFSSHTV